MCSLAGTHLSQNRLRPPNLVVSDARAAQLQAETYRRCCYGLPPVEKLDSVDEPSVADLSDALQDSAMEDDSMLEAANGLTDSGAAGRAEEMDTLTDVDSPAPAVQGQSWTDIIRSVLDGSSPLYMRFPSNSEPGPCSMCGGNTLQRIVVIFECHAVSIIVVCMCDKCNFLPYDAQRSELRLDDCLDLWLGTPNSKEDKPIFAVSGQLARYYARY